jgi:hypothetical protein
MQSNKETTGRKIKLLRFRLTLIFLVYWVFDLLLSEQC